MGRPNPTAPTWEDPCSPQQHWRPRMGLPGSGGLSQPSQDNLSGCTPEGPHGWGLKGI